MQKNNFWGLLILHLPHHPLKTSAASSNLPAAVGPQVRREGTGDP